MGAESGGQDQWKFKPGVALTKTEKRMIVATVMKIAVLVVWREILSSEEGRPDRVAFYLRPGQDSDVVVGRDVHVLGGQQQPIPDGES